MAGKLKLEGDLLNKALKMLKKVSNIFDDNSISYVLEGGTLLGIIRENRLLPWDNDLDITITEDFIPQLLKVRHKIWKAGFRTRIRYHKKNIGPFKKGEIRMMKIQTRKYYFFKDKSLLDIFIKRKSEGKYFWTVGAKNPVLKSVDAKFYENFSTVNFNDYNYSIPKEFEEYLTCRYGNWKITQKEWNFKKDDKAIIKEEK